MASFDVIRPHVENGVSLSRAAAAAGRRSAGLPGFNEMAPPAWCGADARMREHTGYEVNLLR